LEVPAYQSIFKNLFIWKKYLKNVERKKFRGALDKFE
jgi:hypothetical protein